MKTNTLLEEARRIRSLSKRLSTQAAIAGGLRVSGDGLTPGENLPALNLNAQLSSSGNTLTLTPTLSGMLPLYGESGWDMFALIAAVTLDTTGSTSGRLYDIYVSWDQTLDPPTAVLSSVIWTNETTRSVAVTTQDGVTLKESDTQFRLIAVCRYNGSTMLVPKYDPNGEIIFGTGDPRNNVADPHTGVGMSAGGVTFGSYIWQFWAALNGVVGVGFNSSGQLLFGAGAGSLSVDGMRLDALEYPSGVFVEWLTDDTAAQVGSLYSFYTASTSAMYMLGKGKSGSHAGSVGMAAMASGQSIGDYKAIFQLGENGFADLSCEAGTGAGTQGLSIRTETSATNASNTVLSLNTASTGTPANGLGTALAFYISNSTPADTLAGYQEMTWNDKTAGSEDTQYRVILKTAGSDVAALTLTGGAASVPGTLSVGGGAAISKLDEGSYTPTPVNQTNAAASTGYAANWFRVDDIVSVQGSIDIDPTAAGLVEVGIPLPVASTLAAGQLALSGSAHQSNTAGLPLTAVIFGDGTNDRAKLSFTAVTGSLGNANWTYTFSYRVT